MHSFANAKLSMVVKVFHSSCCLMSLESFHMWTKVKATCAAGQALLYSACQQHR